jgi:hypothetical protein
MQINQSYGTEPFRLHHALKTGANVREVMRTDEADFAQMTGNGRQWRGCIGALDGTGIAIERPSLIDLPGRKFWFNRKGYYSVNMQVIVNTTQEILWFSCNAAGSTHDVTAFSMTDLFQDHLRKDSNGSIFGTQHILADSAYSGLSPHIVCPYPEGTNLTKERDDFNFYQSRSRMCVERAIGLLKLRWGVLWRPLQCSYDRVQHVLTCCCILHNLALKHNTPIDIWRARKRSAANPIPYLREGDWTAPVFSDEVWGLADAPNRQGERVDLQDVLRSGLLVSVTSFGLERPAHSVSRSKT